MALRQSTYIKNISRDITLRNYNFSFALLLPFIYVCYFFYSQQMWIFTTSQRSRAAKLLWLWVDLNWNIEENLNCALKRYASNGVDFALAREDSNRHADSFTIPVVHPMKQRRHNTCERAELSSKTYKSIGRCRQIRLALFVMRWFILFLRTQLYSNYKLKIIASLSSTSIDDFLLI